ncbi:hypothetical protein C1646_752144 [Rhizophagus diaphanus]|nr:hypothetical protein C1646_752144 [Rhizophagus diaphanus] [Rhizophagus sp. MUCL 43196]
MELINVNQENSFNPTPKLKSSPVPICFGSYNIEDNNCIHCGERYAETSYIKQPDFISKINDSLIVILKRYKNLQYAKKYFLKEREKQFYSQDKHMIIKSLYNKIELSNRIQKFVDSIYHMIIRKSTTFQEFEVNATQKNFVDLPEGSTFTNYEPGLDL